MGALQTLMKAGLTAQSGHTKCVPCYAYRPFPQHLHAPGDGGLVLQMCALPSSIARFPTPENTFWWMDAQFLPYNDAELVVTSSAFIPRMRQSWIPVRRVPRGRILLYDTKCAPISKLLFALNHSCLVCHLRSPKWALCPEEGFVFTGTESSVYPKVQTHPSGEAIGYAGTAEVRLNSLMNEKLFSRSRGIDNRCHHFCAISPNGAYVAVLSRGAHVIYLEIFHLDSQFLSTTKPFALDILRRNVDFRQTADYHVECKWSSDGSHLAISSSLGDFLLITVCHGNVAAIVTDCIPGVLNCAGAFDFDPRIRFSVVAVGLRDKKMAIVQVDAKTKEETIMLQADTESAVDCVHYSPDGTRLAVSFRTFQVAVYSSDDLSTLHRIDMSDLCSHHALQYQGREFPTVHRLSFSYDARYLATSSCDGYVRVWSVPRLMTLQEWCRKRILQHVSILSVRKYSLPQKVKSFLLSEYF